MWSSSSLTNGESVLQDPIDRETPQMLKLKLKSIRLNGIYLVHPFHFAAKTLYFSRVPKF